MSVRIGEVNPTNVDHAAVHVQASRGGVELHAEPHLTLEPTQARNFAALLIRGAEEVERMRADPVGTWRCGLCGDRHRDGQTHDQAMWDAAPRVSST